MNRNTLVIDNYLVTSQATPPLLTQLGLTAGELAALRRQGFVCRERRGRGFVFKLRFRLAGRQQIRVIGRDADLAMALKKELAEWQRTRRDEREVARWHTQVSAALRGANLRLAPLCEAAGYYFHGRSVRKRRSPHPAATVVQNKTSVVS